MRGEEPEVPLSRAGLALVLGGALVGLSQSGWIARGGSMAETLLLAGGFIVAGGVVATLRVLFKHRKDRGS